MVNGEFAPYLPQSSGYAIILGGGFGFAILMLILSWLQSKFTETSPFESTFLSGPFGRISELILAAQMKNSPVQVETLSLGWSAPGL